VSDGYLRFPHLHDDLVTFVAEDDVWLAPLGGGRAWRVSADRAPARNPRFSPDGSLLAWASKRDGDPEVHLAPTGGEVSTRLTYWGDPNTDVLGWRPDGAVLAMTSAGEPSSRRTWAHALPASGGPGERLPFGPLGGGGLAIAPDGAVLLASAVIREPAWWKRYRGGTAGKIWLDRHGMGEFVRLLADLEGQLASPMWVGERIAFLSDHEGVGSVYSCAPDGSDLRRHTAGEFYARHAGSDGHRVVYEQAGRLWLLDSLDAAEPRELDIALGGPRTGRAPYPVRTGEALRAAAPDHTGRASAVEVRGTLHWLTHRDGPARELSAAPGVRARCPVVLGRAGGAAWVTDAGGEDAVAISGTVPEPGAEAPVLGAGRIGRVLELAASPDGAHLAAVSHDGRLLLLAVGSGEIREVARAGEGEPSGPVFSPDSRWLAWSHPGPEPLRQIRLAALADPAPIEVTALRFADFSPAFTGDGKHLAFLSVRSFDPTYDVHVFELGFPRGCRPHLVPLAADTPSPFDPQPEGRPVNPPKEDDSETDEPPASRVDTEGITERLVAFPVEAGEYSGLQAARGGLLWLSHPPAGELGDERASPADDPVKPGLDRFDLATRTTHRLAEGVDQAWVSGDGRRVLLHKGESLQVISAERKSDDADDDSDGDDKLLEVDLDRIRVTVDPGAEWRQAYDEAGRLMRDHFWRADMNGVDWAAVLRGYRPIVERLGSHDDLVDLLWEVQGELGTSHAYVIPPAAENEAQLRVAALGADLEPDTGRRWRLTRVLPGESSDPAARSPLRAPGVGVRAGDAILAVDARPVDAEAGPAPLLAGSAGKPVELTMAPADGGEPRRVVVTPLRDETPLRYQAWVADRRDYTHAASGGRVGYLHVPDMVASGWAQLHRDLRLEVRRDALVVDVRENRGGHLSQLVVERLARSVIGWSVGRDGYSLETYPADAPRGPVVAVANEFSGSDGDIVNAAIKALGVGPVVGTRTWGGTIGIDMRYHLVDGTLVTQPRYATWMSGPGWGIENHGVDPDIEVTHTPQDWAAGRDPQLDAAIAEALRALQEHPPAAPPELPPPGR
jgi:tricorn protease